MEKSIFLIETDDALRENITELMELEGYLVRSFTIDEAKTTFQDYHSGIFMFNMLTLGEPVQEFVRFLKNKVDGIAALCSDDQDLQIDEVDIKIILPFDHDELLSKLTDFTNRHSLSEA